MSKIYLRSFRKGPVFIFLHTSYLFFVLFCFALFTLFLSTAKFNMFLRHNSLIRKHFNGKKKVVLETSLLASVACLLHCTHHGDWGQVWFKKNKTKQKTNSSLAVVSKSCQRFDDCDPTAQDTHILHIHPSTHSKHRHGSRTGMPSIVFPKPCQHVSPHTLVTLRHKSKANTGSISDKCLYVK